MDCSDSDYILILTRSCLYGPAEGEFSSESSNLPRPPRNSSSHFWLKMGSSIIDNLAVTVPVAGNWSAWTQWLIKDETEIWAALTPCLMKGTTSRGHLSFLHTLITYASDLSILCWIYLEHRVLMSWMNLNLLRYLLRPKAVLSSRNFWCPLSSISVHLYRTSATNSNLGESMDKSAAKCISHLLLPAASYWTILSPHIYAVEGPTFRALRFTFSYRGLCPRKDYVKVSSSHFNYWLLISWVLRKLHWRNVNGDLSSALSETVWTHLR